MARRYSISELLRMRPESSENTTTRRFFASSEYTSSIRSFNSLRGEARQIQWQLRRREVSSDYQQPRSAPSGIAAQQVENFQRFYRAVVSPTHVRVTAGGRIVSNTRAIAPPQPIFEPELNLDFNRSPSFPPKILPNSNQLQPTRSALPTTMAPPIPEQNEQSRAVVIRESPKMEVATQSEFLRYCLTDPDTFSPLLFLTFGNLLTFQ